MKRTNKQAHFIVVLALLIIGCSTNQEKDFIALTGATIYDGTGNEIEDGIVIIKDENIYAIGSEISIPKNSEIIDLSGKYITPGFIDAHVHIASSGFFDDHGPAILADSFPLTEKLPISRYQHKRFFDAYLRSGVTAVYDVGGWTWAIDLQNTSEGKRDIPHYFATGPIINAWFTGPTYDPIFYKPQNIVEGREAASWFTALGSTGIKIYELELGDSDHLEVIKNVIEEAKTQGNFAVAHAMNLDGAKEVVKMGARVLVHSVVDEPIDEEFIQLLNDNNVVYTPNLVVLGGYINARKVLMGESIPLDDPNNVLDERTKDIWNNAHDYFGLVDSAEFTANAIKEDIKQRRQLEIAQQNLKTLYRAGIPMAIGSDAGNPGTHHGISYIGELELLQEAGISTKDLITSATLNGAKILNKESIIGTLEEGKIADLVIMDEDPIDNISNIRTMTHVMHYGILRSVKDVRK